MWYVGKENTLTQTVAIDGIGVQGLDMSLYLSRLSDGKFWDDDLHEWVVSPFELPATERSAANFPGLYVYEFTPDTEDVYIFRFFDADTTVDISGSFEAIDLLQITDIDYMAIEYDFTTYTKAVIKFYDIDRPFGVTDPIYWCYAYTAAGGKPSTAAEITKRDTVKYWSIGTPT